MIGQATIPLFCVGDCDVMEGAAAEVLRSGQIASGPNVEAFRAAVARVIGNEDVVTVSDMSLAIAIALRLEGVGPGDEVIASPFACLSTNSPIALCGATIRWADVDPATGALDVDDVRRLINDRTKAVLLYHLAGYPGPAKALRAVCSEAGIALIEDCDNAMGALLDGEPLGRSGDHAIYSFYPNRQVNGLEGGAIACKDAAKVERAARLRRFGIDQRRFRDATGEIADDANVEEIGWSGAMSNLNSAIGLTQIGQLPERLVTTRANADYLQQALAEQPGVAAFDLLPGASPAYWVLMARSANRDRLLAHLKSHGISASKLHQRNDRYSGMPAERRNLPGVNELDRSALAIPCGWWLGKADLARIEKAIATLPR